VTRGTDAVGQLRDFSYDPNGNLLAETLRVSNVQLDQRLRSYDLSDRLLAKVDAGASLGYQYDPAGNVTAITNADGFTLHMEYDRSQRLVKASNEQGNAVTRTLDLDGKPRSITDPNGHTVRYEYWDATKEGRLKTQTDALNRATTFDYDPHGNVTSVTDNLARTTLSTYDERNRPTRIVGPVYTDATYGSIRPVTKHTYDLLGRLTQVQAGRTDASGTNPASDVVTPQMSYGWDDFGRKLRETDALTRSWVMTYDPQGNPLSITDPKSQQTTFTYGYGHQLLTRTSGGQTTTWTRNLLGQATQVQSPEVTYTYAYDPVAHRVLTATDSRGPKTLSYAWSPGGRLNAMEDSEGRRTDYIYDAIGRLAQIWAPTGDLIRFLYDAGGRLTEKVLANGVSTRYGYNPDNTLSQVVNRHADTLLSQHDYTYDGVGNRQTHAELIAGTTTPYKYVYDPLNRLSEVRNNTTNALIESYAFDPLGNRTPDPGRQDRPHHLELRLRRPGADGSAGASAPGDVPLRRTRHHRGVRELDRGHSQPSSRAPDGAAYVS